LNIKAKTSEALYKVREIKDLKELLYSSAELYKNNIAFKYKEDGKIVDVTYEQFKNDVDALGTALLDLNLKNQKIAVIGLNSYKWCVSYLATVCGTGVIVPIDKALPYAEINNLITGSGATAVFFDSKYLDIFKQIKAEENSRVKTSNMF